MSYAIVYVVVEKLAEQLLKEASPLLNFRKDFQWVKDQLKSLGDYLEDAHQKSILEKSVKQWLMQIQEVVFDAEDIVDEWVAHSVYHNKISWSRIIFKHKIGRRIRELKARMNSIDAEVRRLQLLSALARTEQTSTSSRGAEKWKRPGFLESNARPVAIGVKVDEILMMLDNPAHHVIAVVGMGGVGKTFLLQNVYVDLRTKSRFEECIWLSISQTYSLQKLQSEIASRLHLKGVVASRFTEQGAAELIHRCLQGKKILIVLDDVWRMTELNNLIERLGVHAANKIVVPTRDREVCSVMNASYIYEMEVLGGGDSWNLFCVYAFPNEREKRPPPHLKELAMKVEGKCGKLPLALKTVGASMANEQLPLKWERKLQELEEARKAAKRPQDPIMEILQLSYDSLPPELKPCFFYFAFFGEDEEIDVDYLIELWRAEGFIDGNGWKETGLKYFDQLSKLCLVEAKEDWWLSKSCKMHDLLLDLAIYVCKENKYGCSVDDVRIKTKTRDSSGWTQFLSKPHRSSGCRRIFLAKKGITDDDIADNTFFFPKSLRTLSLAENPKIKSIPASLFSKVRALRVLDLSGTSISTLPNSIGCLKLLKVLNLRRTNIKEVPECIRSLRNLCRLVIHRNINRDIFAWSVRIPDWIGELKCLEHLVIDAESMPKTISELRSLRVLRLYSVVLSVEENGLLRLEDIKKLVRLEDLRIQICYEEELERMKEGVFQHLVNMRRLTIYNNIPSMENSDDVPLFPDNLTTMMHLEHLDMERFVVPSWICEFVNLRVLRLWECQSTEYPALESLPNLITLSLGRNRKCRIMRESFGRCWAFPKLRVLAIYEFPMLEELRVLERGSMPCLEELRLMFCPRVGGVEGLDHLKSLKIFQLKYSGTDECRERLKEEGEQWKKLNGNNPRVQISL